MGFKKEYHVFDVQNLPFSQHFYPVLSDKEGAFSNQRNNQASKLIEFIKNPRSYFEYFENLCGQSVRITGDITPSYCFLPANVLSDVRASLHQYGFEPRVLYVIRDPIDRLLSYARMSKRFGLLEGKRFPKDTELTSVVQMALDLDAVQRSLDYATAIENLRSVFPEGELLITSYERLFTPDGIGQFSAFLELDARSEFLNQKFNQSARESEEIPSGQMSQIRSGLAQQYDFCAREFPEFELNRGWRYFNSSEGAVA